MTIRRLTVRVTAAGSAGAAIGEASTGPAADGVIDDIHIDYLLRLAFTSGSATPLVGDTISGATSGATGVVVAVDVTSGAWDSGDAAGNIYINTQVGTFQSENLDNDDTGGSNFATIAADSTAVVNTTDVTVSERSPDTANGPDQTLLTVSNNNTSAWYAVRKALVDNTGATIVGPADYFSVGQQIKVAMAGANAADSVLVTIKYDDQRR